MVQPIYFYYASLIISYILFISFMITNSLTDDNGKTKKYTSNDFLMKVFLPNAIGIVLLAIGFIGINSIDYNERKLGALSYTVALVASAIAISSIMLSISRLRWAAD